MEFCSNARYKIVLIKDATCLHAPCVTGCLYELLKRIQGIDGCM